MDSVSVTIFPSLQCEHQLLHRLKEEPEVLILRMRKVVAMDATGLNSL